jgi:xylan 1,4-beta-xylosidase
MSNAKLLCLLIFCLFLLSSLILAQPSVSPTTFCNPLNLNYRFMADAVDAREAADPVVVLFKDDYYLFASRSGGYWTSTDLRNWTLIIPSGLDIETYAPAVAVIGDTLIYIPSNTAQSYKTADPKSGVWTKGPTVKNYGDPDLFLDDNGRLYMYYGLSNVDYIRVVELNPVTLQEIGSPVIIFNGQASQHGWERRGDDNLLDEQPWIEGSWMVKENGKYYLHYAAPGTEWKTYADGIYVADSAKGPFTYATYSPFSFKPTGFICGAGHGSTFKDKDGQYWHIATMTISVQHMFERRLGLFPVGFDTDGNIHCNTAWGDYPQYFPGENENPEEDNFAGAMLLSRKKYVQVSSTLTEYDAGSYWTVYSAEEAVDEDARSFWCAQTGDSSEWLMVDLGKECAVQSIQVNFAEYDTDPALVRGRNNVLFEQYVIYTSTDGKVWEILVDKSENIQDVPHDYIELQQEAAARYVKIKNVFTPGQGKFALRDLRIFGNSEQTVFTQVDDFSVERSEADGRDAIIRWTAVADADGYIIRYGIDRDKLYNNYMVYGIDTVAIHSLNHGVEYYFSVEAFNNGTEDYRPFGEFRSFQSGIWDEPGNWEQYDGTGWVNPAPAVPGSVDAAITIMNGHTIIVASAADTVDQLTVAAGGTLQIDPGQSLHIADGVGTDLMVEGNLINFGSINKESSASITFTGDGTYSHKQNGGSLPPAIWRPNSVCQFDSITTTVPDNANQNFYNVIWNCPNQSARLSTGWNGNTIGGNITVISTGSEIWYMCGPAAGASATVTLKGDIIQSGGQFSSNGTGNDATTVTINQNGNINVTAGNFAISRGSQGDSAGTGITVWNLNNGNVSLAGATTQNSCPRARFVFTKAAGTQTLTFTDVTFGGGGFPAEVDSGTTLDMGTNILRGSGIFNLKMGAGLMTAHQAGLDSTLSNTGTRTLDKAANYLYNGTQAQVTGTILPDTVGNLTCDNSAGILLSNDVTVNGTMELINGSANLNGHTLRYGTNGSLKYSGASARTTSDAEFPLTNGPRNLIAANTNTNGVILHASRTIENLILSGRLKLENNNFTVNNITIEASNRYILTNGSGFLKLTSVGSEQVLFPVGTTVYTPVWITNTGVVDTVGVSVMSDGTSASYPRVRVKWNLSENNAGAGNYMVQFGWSSNLENPSFRANRATNARIYNLTDTTEAGSGDYSTQFVTQPYTTARAGISTLGPFAVGRFDLATGLTEDAELVPLKFSLSQNYPNPFNPTTTISYSLGAPAKVSVIIYNVLGEKVKTLVDLYQTSGLHSVLWNATDDRNNQVSSGIYFYQLITNNLRLQKKMMVLR